MKHFIDIEHIRLEDDEFKQNNVFGFEVGDHISIQTKIDGSNASVYYNNEIGGLQACSRKQELTYNNNLNGFCFSGGSINAYKALYDANQDVFISGFCKECL